jgi:hypothetical protein
VEAPLAACAHPPKRTLSNLDRPKQFVTITDFQLQGGARLRYIPGFHSNVDGIPLRGSLAFRWHLEHSLLSAPHRSPAPCRNAFRAAFLLSVIGRLRLRTMLSASDLDRWCRRLLAGGGSAPWHERSSPSRPQPIRCLEPTNPMCESNAGHSGAVPMRPVASLRSPIPNLAPLRSAAMLAGLLTLIHTRHRRRRPREDALSANPASVCKDDRALLGNGFTCFRLWARPKRFTLFEGIRALELLHAAVQRGCGLGRR